MIMEKIDVVECMGEAVEKMAFMMVMPDEDYISVPEEAIVSEIGFKGNFTGKIQIAAGQEFVEEFAQNFAAVEEVDEELCMSALGELTNVLSGLIMPVFDESSDKVFEITVPDGGKVRWEDFSSQDGVTVLNIEGFPVAVRVQIDN